MAAWPPICNPQALALRSPMYEAPGLEGWPFSSDACQPSVDDRQSGSNSSTGASTGGGILQVLDDVGLRAVQCPLAVDIDGSLIAGDLLIESLALLLRRSPLSIFLLPVWLARGRLGLKRQVARRVVARPEVLVFNREVVNEVVTAQAAGREVWLASAAHEIAVAPVAEHIGATGFLASDGSVNLAGEAKARALAERFGEGGFDYIGNERRDLAVWRRARRAIGVGLGLRLRRKVLALDRDARFLPSAGGRVQDYLLALRPWRWLKNALAFAPLVVAHETEAGRYALAGGAFVALSLCASAGYLQNDLLRLAEHRLDDGKRDRPLASGRVRLQIALGLSSALLTTGLVLGFALGSAVGLWLLFYVGVGSAYSLVLERRPFLGVVALAILYAVRVLAGAAAAAVAMDPWWLALVAVALAMTP